MADEIKTATPLRAAAAQPQVTTPAPAQTQRTPGTSLVPKITPDSSTATIEHVYWCGVLPSCPVEWIDAAGINFPKVTEELLPNPGQPGKYRRVPRIGSLVRVDVRRLKALEKALPLKVIRFLSTAEQDEEQRRAEAEATANGRMKNLGDVAARPRRGYPISIPTEDDRKSGEERGRHRPYVAKPGDEPAARYMFMVRCTDQRNPSRGDFYPEPLEATGLEYPPTA